MRLLDAIKMAGDFTESADKRMVYVIREGKVSGYDFDEFNKTKDPAKNPVLMPGDRIQVREAPFKIEETPKSAASGTGVASGVSVVEEGRKTVSVVVLGHVKNPGTYEFPGGQTWRMIDAISAAGGLTRLANANKIELTRKGKTSEYKFEELRKADDPEKSPALEPGDIVFVREMIF